MWLQELEWHLFGVVYMLGAGYTMLYDEHVRVDIVYSRWSSRKKAWSDFLSLSGVLLPVGDHDRLDHHPLRPELVPRLRGLARSGRHPVRFLLKSVIIVGFVILMIQAFSQTVKNFFWAMGWEEREFGSRRSTDAGLDQTLAGLMFAGMIAFLFFGFPVAFSLIFTGGLFGLAGMALGVLNNTFFDILPLRLWGTMTNFTLLWRCRSSSSWGWRSKKSGLAEELLETMALLFGKMRGGIAISVVVVGAILAASTGIRALRSSPWAWSRCRPCSPGISEGADHRNDLRVRHPRSDHPADVILSCSATSWAFGG